MNDLLSFVAAMVISMVMIPIMVRLAPRFGLMDRPNERKVHAIPVPRVGGIGIVIGVLVPVVFLLPMDNLVRAYVLGALVLFLFGLWDDISEIGHYPKFVGQLIAVMIVVLYGDLYVVSFPFVPGGEISPILGVPFTILALVGMINAINHSDGLDGLAGGESLFSLGAIALLAVFARDAVALTIALTVIGGILGFLRYNTHPARVFMGDSGSQFLGYTLGFLAILLTQIVDTELSPAVPLLLLGLPVIDIIAVLWKRAHARSNLFRATRNHIHHRLLDLGFVHQESVIIIYSLQMIFVTGGVLLRYESNWLITGVYISLCLAVFFMLNLAERSGFNMELRRHKKSRPKVIDQNFIRRVLVVIPRRVLAIGIPAYLVGTSLAVTWVPHDFGAMSLVVLSLLVVELFVGNDPRSLMRRALIYITVVFIGFLGMKYSPSWADSLEPAKVVFFTFTAVAFAAAVKFSPRRRKIEFRTTATDFLVMLCLLAALVITKGDLWGKEGTTFIVEMGVIFYGCELLVTETRGRWNILSTAALVTAAILAYRGLLSAWL